MYETQDDSRALRTQHRRALILILPMAACLLAAGWFVSQWIERRFGVEARLARSATMVGVLLLAWPLGEMILRGQERHALAPRQRVLAAERQARRGAAWRPLLIILLGVLFAARVLRLFGGGPIAGPAENWDLAGTAIIALGGFRENLFAPGDAAAGDGHRRIRLLQAAQHAFATLLVLAFAALLYDGAHPGTLALSLPAALIGGILAAQVSLLLQERASRPRGVR